MIRLVGVLCLAAFVLAACGGGSTLSRTTPAPGGGSTSAPGRASIQFSGTVSGDLSSQGISCQPAGSANLIVSISGTVGSAQYTIDIGAGRPGTYELSGRGDATVGMTETRPSFRQWAVGFQQASGSGSLAIEQQSGQVNAELTGVQGAPGTVRVQGSWTCP